MRVSTLYKPEPSEPQREDIPASRIVLWSVVAVVISVGIALYFVYERGVTPLL